MANKIILVTGVQSGVGKTTLAANLAAYYARLRHQPVLLVDNDPQCRGTTARTAGTPLSPTVIDLLEQLAKQPNALPMLRGRVPTNRHHIGCIPLAPKSS